MNTLHEKGFTLIEILIVIALIGILSIMSVPQFKKMKIEYDLSNDMMLMKSTINRAKLEAMKLGAFTTVTFTPTGSGGATYVAFFDANRDGILNSGETTIGNGTFQATSIMATPSFTDSINGGLSLQFNPMGFPLGLNASGLLQDYSGTIDARCTSAPGTVIYQRLTVSTSGLLTISKQSTPFT